MSSTRERINDGNLRRLVKQYLSIRKQDVISQYGPISEWDVSNVTDMSGLFSKYREEDEVDEDEDEDEYEEDMYDYDQRNDFEHFDEDISKWDVSNVTNMRGMFEYAIYFNQDISRWNVSNVTNMSDMFHNAAEFNQPIGIWNVSNVTNMSGMFSGADSFDQPLDRWEPPLTKGGMHLMFFRCPISIDNVPDTLIGGLDDERLYNLIKNEETDKYVHLDASRLAYIGCRYSDFKILKLALDKGYIVTLKDLSLYIDFFKTHNHDDIDTENKFFTSEIFGYGGFCLDKTNPSDMLFLDKVKKELKNEPKRKTTNEHFIAFLKNIQQSVTDRVKQTCDVSKRGTKKKRGGKKSNKLVRNKRNTKKRHRNLAKK